MTPSRFLYGMGIAFLFVLSCAQAQAASNRVALVIGNSAYNFTPALRNPKSDAVDMAAALRQLDFQVFDGTDLTKAQMDGLIKTFAAALETSSAALFFYAGHAVQIDNKNYLVPVDAALTSPEALDSEAVRLDQIQASMERQPRTNILILDACRNNPLARRLERAVGTGSARVGSGLAAVEGRAGTLIAYSTQPDNVALDGDGPHSPFSGALLKYIGTKGEDLSTILISVRNEVMNETGGRQVPWEHSALSKRFYFITPDAPPPAATADASPVAATADVSRSAAAAPVRSDPGAEIELWDSVTNSNSIPKLRSYLERYPHGAFARVAELKIEDLESRTGAASSPVRATPAPEVKTAAPSLAPANPAPEVKTAAPSPAPADPAPEVKTAALNQAPANPAEAEDANPELSAKLQKELHRIGCYSGPLDGKWNDASDQALAKFAEIRGSRTRSLASLEPNQASLDAVSAEKSRVCPLTCGPGTVERNGICVVQPSKTKPATVAKPRKHAPQRETEVYDDDDDNDYRPARPRVAQQPKQQQKKNWELCFDQRGRISDCDQGGVGLRIK
ncbi:MAG TPA: caspase domain-containing protein [Hyphomicrobiales bacterium]|jgi:uncharacterized caspase-like protein